MFLSSVWCCINTQELNKYYGLDEYSCGLMERNFYLELHISDLFLSPAASQPSDKSKSQNPTDFQILLFIESPGSFIQGT